MAATSSDSGPLFYYISNKHAILGLAFVGGFIDATGYVKLYGLFTSSITGNLVVASTAFFGNGVGVFARIIVSFAFGFGVFMASTWAITHRHVKKHNQWDMGVKLFGAEIACLFITMIFGIGLDYSPGVFPGIDSWQAILMGTLLALSMGVHNAAAQEMIVNCPSTTVMTMTIVKTSMFAANTFQYYLATRSLTSIHPPGEKPSDYEINMKKSYDNYMNKFIDSLKPLIVFVLGATIGAVLALNMTYWSLILPILVISSLVYSIYKAQQIYINIELIKNVDIEQQEYTLSPMTDSSATIDNCSISDIQETEKDDNNIIIM